MMNLRRKKHLMKTRLLAAVLSGILAAVPFHGMTVMAAPAQTVPAAPTAPQFVPGPIGVAPNAEGVYVYCQYNDALLSYMSKYMSFKGTEVSAMKWKVPYQKDEPRDLVIATTAQTATIRDGYTGRTWVQPAINNMVFVHNLTPGVNSTVTVGKTTYTVRPEGFVRMIYAPSIYNVRDLGGWPCDGGMIKFGKIYRGGEMNGDNHIQISAEGIQTLRNLGINQDVDLRGAGETGFLVSSPLGADVLYTRVTDRGCGSGSGAVGWAKDYTIHGLRLLMQAACEGRVAYFHCYEGADRTGTMAILLEAMLGVEPPYLAADYELTTFSETPGSSPRTRMDTNFVNLRNYFNNAYPGPRFRDRVVQWAVQNGITIEEINAFRQAMINGTPDILQ